MRADQWVVYFIGAMLGMILPAVLYVTFIEGGTDIRGLSVAAALADAMATREGALFGGIIALALAQPIYLLQLGANMAGIVFVVSSLHLLYINTRLLPPEIRPPLWRRAALVAMSSSTARSWCSGCGVGPGRRLPGDSRPIQPCERNPDAHSSACASMSFASLRATSSPSPSGSTNTTFLVWSRRWAASWKKVNQRRSVPWSRPPT